MGYLHIDNLYLNQTILAFRRCYAMEKIHGTSSHIRWKDGKVTFHAGGLSAEKFRSLFDLKKLEEGFQELGNPDVTVYGEAYGGKMQGQGWRYGKELKFVAFDVQILGFQGGAEKLLWLSVPKADKLVQALGLEFVHYVECDTDLASLDAERDATSAQAARNGVPGFIPREGVVLRPLEEFTTNDGDRVIVKHKRHEERETKNPREVKDPALLEVLTEASAIADEWVTHTRLEHVLSKLSGDLTMKDTPMVITAMIEDVLREGRKEVVDSKEARAAISRKTGQMFKSLVLGKFRK